MPDRREPAARTVAAPLAAAPGWDLQTAYGVARIEQDPSRHTGRLLFMDGIESSYVDLADPLHLEFGYIQRIADVADLMYPGRRAVDVVHIGGGGFALPRWVAATRPRSRQVVYEKDAGLVLLARQYLGLRSSPRLRVRIGDARERLAQRPQMCADIVVGDAFDGVVVPAHLATLEFARLVRRVLRPGGVFVFNIIDCPPMLASRTAAATVLAAFEHVALAATKDLLAERDAGNVLLVASTAPLPVPSLAQAASRGTLPEEVLDRAGVADFAGDAAVLHDGDTVRWYAAAPSPDLPVPAPATPDLTPPPGPRAAATQS